MLKKRVNIYFSDLATLDKLKKLAKKKSNETGKHFGVGFIITEIFKEWQKMKSEIKDKGDFNK